MEKIAFLVERLNQPPFRLGIATMSEFDSKSSLEVLDILCDVVIAIDPDLEQSLKSEATEARVQRILGFLSVMKFNIRDDQVEDFQQLLMTGDKEILHSVMHWSLQKFEHLQKRAYLAKYLMPLEIPPEFMSDDLVLELSENLKGLQQQFKEIHKSVDQLRASSGIKPQELKQEINQLEQEKSQLQSKIQRLKKEKESMGDDSYFEEMLKVTSALRREQEEEAKIYERLRENRAALEEAELRYGDAARRLSEARSSGMQSLSANDILSRLQKEVRDLGEKREQIENNVSERESYLEKLVSWDSNAERVMTEHDLREKRSQVVEVEDQLTNLQERLEQAMERNSKLAVFRQASSMALKKLREKEEEMDRLTDEKRRVTRQIDEKEAEMRAQGRAVGLAGAGKGGKMDLKKYGALVREKIEKYKRMREELSSLRAELVVIQRTEQILKSRHKNLDDFLADLERQKGVEGYRDTQRELIEMTEKAAEVDQAKGATLEQISAMVEQIGREFKSKQAQLQPLMSELKTVRHEYMEVEASFAEKKSTYDKVAVGLEMEKQALERDCDSFQEECLREESRYHSLNSLISIAKNRLARAEQEKRWQAGDGRMMRDFASLKELYAHKLMQQDQLTKQLRKQQKDLKETAGAMTNQKTQFRLLHQLLQAKMNASSGAGLLDPMMNLMIESSLSSATGGGAPVRAIATTVGRGPPGGSTRRGNSDVMTLDD